MGPQNISIDRRALRTVKQLVSDRMATSALGARVAKSGTPEHPKDCKAFDGFAYGYQRVDGAQTSASEQTIGADALIAGALDEISAGASES